MLGAGLPSLHIHSPGRAPARDIASLYNFHNVSAETDAETMCDANERDTNFVVCEGLKLKMDAYSQVRSDNWVSPAKRLNRSRCRLGAHSQSHEPCRLLDEDRDPSTEMDNFGVVVVQHIQKHCKSLLRCT